MSEIFNPGFLFELGLTSLGTLGFFFLAFQALRLLKQP